MYSRPTLLALTLYVAGALAGPLNLVERAQCYADGCARAVTGTQAENRLPASSRRADCSSFMGTSTVTPKQVTATQVVTVTVPQSRTVQAQTTRTVQITAYTTSTTTINVPQTIDATFTEVDPVTVTAVVTDFNKRSNPLEARATTVPAYASQCSGAAGYSSACSCFGVTRMTVTATAPTTTSTVTVTASPTVVITVTSEVLVTSTLTVPIVATATNTQPTTVTGTTVTVLSTTSVTVPTSCPSSDRLVNGGFESGALSPFTFETSPTIFDTSGGSAAIVQNPSLAHGGNYFLSINAAIEFTGVSFALRQPVSLCPGAVYKLNFFTSSQCPRAGACACDLQACLGDSCQGFDPPGGDAPRYGYSFTFTAPPASGDVELRINTDFCERAFVRFDDFALTIVR